MIPQLHSCGRVSASQAAPHALPLHRRINLQELHRCVQTNAVMQEKSSMLEKQMRPDREGRFGSFGGRYVPETLIPALTALVEDYEKARADPHFEV
jgi:hypothetical protein